MTNNRFRDPNYGEPKFTKELTKVELSQALNWYTQNRDKKASLKYATDYFKKKLKLSAESTLKKNLVRLDSFVESLRMVDSYHLKTLNGSMVKLPELKKNQRRQNLL